MIFGEAKRSIERRPHAQNDVAIAAAAGDVVAVVVAAVFDQMVYRKTAPMVRFDG